MSKNPTITNHDELVFDFDFVSLDASSSHYSEADLQYMLETCKDALRATPEEFASRSYRTIERIKAIVFPHVSVRSQIVVSYYLVDLLNINNPSEQKDYVYGICTSLIRQLPQNAQDKLVKLVSNYPDNMYN